MGIAKACVSLLDVHKLRATVDAILEHILELYERLVGINLGHHALVEDVLAVDGH